MSIDQRTLDLQQIAIDIQEMVNRHIVDPITIVYVEMTEKVREEDRQLQRFRVTEGDELMAQLARKF